MNNSTEKEEEFRIPTNALLMGCIVLLLVVIGLLAYRTVNPSHPAPVDKNATDGPVGHWSEAQYIEQVQKCIDNQAYEDGIIQADEGLRLYPESETLTELKRTCQEHADSQNSNPSEDEILDNAYEFEVEDNFDEALSTIEDGLKLYPDSSALKDKRREYQQCAEDINNYIARAAYKSSNDEARSELQKGLEKYPKSKKLADELRVYPPVSKKELPYRWYGTYEGTFRRNDGSEYTVERNTMLVLDGIYTDGPVTGTFYVDAYSDHEDRFRVEGTFDSSSRTLTVWWTEWVVNSGTISRRQFWGTLTEDYQYMDGETTTLEGEHWSNWDSYAE